MPRPRAWRRMMGATGSDDEAGGPSGASGSWRSSTGAQPTIAVGSLSQSARLLKPFPWLVARSPTRRASPKATLKPLPTPHRLARIPSGRVDASRRAVWYACPTERCSSFEFLEVVVGASNAGRFRLCRATRLACARSYLSACRRSPHFHSRVSRRRDARPRLYRPSRSSSPTTRRRLVCFAARVWSRPRAESTPSSSRRPARSPPPSSGRAHGAALRVGVSRPRVTSRVRARRRRVDARSVSASVPRVAPAVSATPPPARAAVPCATSHRRKSAISASASTADGSSSRERASDPDYGSHADAVHAFEDDSEDDSYEAFVASWRSSLPTMEPNERAEAHRESCAEGRRRANEKRRKRAVRSRTSLPFLRELTVSSSSRSSATRRAPPALLPLPRDSSTWHQPDRLVTVARMPSARKTVPLGWRRASI